MENSEFPFTNRPEARSFEERALQLQTDLDVIQSRYGVVVELSQTTERQSDRLGFGRSISYEPVTQEAAAVPVAAIRENLALYPPEYIHALRVRKIKPVRNFRESSIGIQIKELGGIPVVKNGLIYIDVQSGHEIYVAENLHHELSHFTDRDFSRFGGRRKRGEWVRLNTAGGKAYQVNEEYFSNRAVDQERPEGFASLYGSFNIEEDRAEVAKLIMLMGGAHGYLKNLMEKDEVLKRKILATLAYMNDKSGGKIPDRFLDDLEAKIVNEDYWGKGNIA
ncbi:hypothetical protein HYZ78_00435 [Candidatus Microgenomates bacterium]|nr:hypothetical protein [Candidatus Microgenomates bacterium]